MHIGEWRPRAIDRSLINYAKYARMRNTCIRKVISNYFFLYTFLSLSFLRIAEFTAAKWKSLISPNAPCIGYVSGFPNKIPLRTRPLANNSPKAIETGEVLGGLLLCLCRQGATQPHRKFLPADSTFRSRTREKAIVSTESTVRAQKFTTAIADVETSRGTTRIRARGFVPSFETSWIII